jgi:hypothetical protein
MGWVTAAMPLLLGLLYLVGHAGLYVALLRGQPALDSERGIFLYHFLSAVLLAVALAIWAAVSDDPEACAWFVAVVMLHGLYSLSFLELWALADDSYSLAIMEIIARGNAAAPSLMRKLEAIGTGKQTSRLDALQAMGLVHAIEDGSFTLTLAGRVVALLGRTLLALVNVRKFG